jgi:uncharacterized protein YdaT
MDDIFREFADQMEDLKPEVQEKAKEIANQLIKDKKLSTSDAIKEGMREAELWFLNSEG